MTTYGIPYELRQVLEHSAGHAVHINRSGQGWYVDPLVARWWITPFPGSIRICVINGVWLSYNLRNKGIGSLLCKWRLDIARDFGYKVALATVLNSNVASRKCMESSGYRVINRGKKELIMRADLSQLPRTFDS